MLTELLKNPRALLFAILVHVVLVLLLVVSLQWVEPPPSLQGSEKIVQAVVIDESKTHAAAERAKQDEQRRQAEAEAKRAAEEQRKQAAEQRKADDAARKQQQVAERQHQQQVEVERALQERQLAQQKRLAEQDSKRKIEAEQKRKAETEVKRKADEEAKRRAEEEAKRKADDDAKRKAAAEAKRKADEEAKAKAEEARRQQEAKELLQQQLAQEEQQQVAGETQKKMDALKARYIALITQKVQRNWGKPPDARAGMSCEVFVRLIPGGEVVEARVVKSSGNVLFDRSVETAVFRASPLPMPTEAALLNQFRELRFVFKPEG